LIGHEVGHEPDGILRKSLLGFFEKRLERRVHRHLGQIGISPLLHAEPQMMHPCVILEQFGAKKALLDAFGVDQHQFPNAEGSNRLKNLLQRLRTG
jgi:hypothetical protein